MSAPTVACVMLANGRPEMVARAVKSFRAQTYDDRQLVIWDTGGPGVSFDSQEDGIVHCWRSKQDKLTIGQLRNNANLEADALGCDIICHWDSDDWSHPNRIAEQVALLQSSGAECVGYNEMLFWCENTPGWIGAHEQAWLYRSQLPNYALGTSMCYWRKTWERFPFFDRNEFCDDLYWFNGDKDKGLARVKIVSDLAFSNGQNEHGPRMIASIHGGNTCAAIMPGTTEWTRVNEWDEYCRTAMRLG